MKLGIEKTKEVFASLKKLGAAGEKIMADGKVNMEDLPVAVGLLTELGAIIESVKGAGEAFKELKELDKEEAQVVVGEVYDLFEAISGHKP